MEEFAANFFKNIALHLRRNKNLKPTIEFVKALKEYPGMAIVVNTYA